ncbi:MAG: GAF and ANTAR domain-containing protein [Actinomycetota bacterium]|nr:GAF and ANTAR domain-containing protein [Actinomycetota bacterium]
MAKRSMNTAAGRRALVAELIAIQSVDGESLGMVVMLEQLCRAATHNLGVVGVAVSLMSNAGSVGVVAGADKRSVSIDELQFTLGEGPSHDAFALRRPVLTADLQSGDGRKWPGYSAAAQEAGVHAVFAFPLHIGAAAFGVLNVYVSRAGPLEFQQLTMALTFAEIATEVLLNEDTDTENGRLHLGVETVLNYRAEIYQAQGAVMVELGVSLGEALVRMRAYAFANDQSLAELASGIMSGDIELGSD